MNSITIEEFQKVEIRVGKILSSEKVPDSEKLLKLIVDFGEDNPRQVVSGISKFIPKEEDLIGKKCVFATNISPRVIKGLESQAMILAVSSEEGEGHFSLLEVKEDIPSGSKVK
jgi:methionine--tRNA ligase beta chain